MTQRDEQGRRPLHIWPEEVRFVEGMLEVRARIEWPGNDPDFLWYRLPEMQQASLTESLDPFVIGTLFLAMRRATNVHVHGWVSPSLLRNLEEYQAAWSCWFPHRYRPVQIQADTEAEEATAQTDGVGMMFSGGLDSCFTAWRHTRGNCGRRRRKLESAVMVHGFDIPLDEPEVFGRAAENSTRLAGSVGLELIPMVCNIRQFGGDWEQEHGAALASCLHLLRRRFSAGLVAGSHVYNALRFPWGSTPLTDVMLSSQSLSIVYDGADYSRHEKAREVAKWSEAMAGVRVCWEGEHKDRNCGVCLRCVGTAICFAVEQQRIPSSLPMGSLDQAIRELESQTLGPVAVTRLDELLKAAKSAHIKEPWVNALQKCVHRQRRAMEAGTKGSEGKLRRRLRRLLSLSHSARRKTVPCGEAL